MSDSRILFEHILSDQFVQRVKEYIKAYPDGFKEYDLICHLDNEGCFLAISDEENTTLLLFQKHFLLFHILYTINNELVKDKQGSLHISPLLIQQLDHIEAKSQVGAVDALSEYYLDLNNLVAANEENVNILLDKFWEQYLRNDRRGDALKVLGLSDPVSDREITQRYRKLASVHHPDKGGAKDKIQEINEAYAVLIKV